MKNTATRLLENRAMLVMFMLSLIIYGNSYCKDAEIFKAIEDGNVELTLQLAKNGQMEAVADNGTTPLIAAALTGNLELVKALVEKGADIKHRDRTGFTVFRVLGSLCARSKVNKEKQAEHLRKQGFPEEFVKNLIAASAIPEKYKGKEKQFTEILNYLNEIKEKRQTELFKAIEAGDVERVGELARISLVDELGPNGRTPLITAALRGSIEMVRILLDAGSRTFVRDKDGLNATMAMDVMLRASAANEKNGNNGLYVKQKEWYEKAVQEIGEPSEKMRNNYKTILTLLVTRDKASAALGSSSNPPLFKAVAEGNVDKVRILAAHSNLEEKNSDGFTPLMVAAFCGQLDVVKALIAAGSRMDTRGRDGKTVVEMLEEMVGKSKDEIEKARIALNEKGMTDKQIEDAVSEGKRLPGYPSKKQLQRIKRCEEVLEYLKPASTAKEPER